MLTPGAAVVVRNHLGVHAYGRVRSCDGGLLRVLTPAGSELTAGVIWVREATGAYMEQLLEFEDHAGAEGQPLYAGLLRALRDDPEEQKR